MDTSQFARREVLQEYLSNRPVDDDALDWAVSQCSEDDFPLIREHLKDRVNGEYLLASVAGRCGRDDLVMKFIAAPYHRFALLGAVNQNRFPCARSLLAHPGFERYFWVLRHALHHAVVSGHMAMISLMLEHGAMARFMTVRAALHTPGFPEDMLIQLLSMCDRRSQLYLECARTNREEWLDVLWKRNCPLPEDVHSLITRDVTLPTLQWFVRKGCSFRPHESYRIASQAGLSQVQLVHSLGLPLTRDVMSSFILLNLESMALWALEHDCSFDNDNVHEAVQKGMIRLLDAFAKKGFVFDPSHSHAAFLSGQTSAMRYFCVVGASHLDCDCWAKLESDDKVREWLSDSDYFCQKGMCHYAAVKGDVALLDQLSTDVPGLMGIHVFRLWMVRHLLTVGREASFLWLIRRGYCASVSVTALAKRGWVACMQELDRQGMFTTAHHEHCLIPAIMHRHTNVVQWTLGKHRHVLGAFVLVAALQTNDVDMVRCVLTHAMTRGAALDRSLVMSSALQSCSEEIILWLLEQSFPVEAEDLHQMVRRGFLVAMNRVCGGQEPLLAFEDEVWKRALAIAVEKGHEYVVHWILCSDLTSCPFFDMEDLTGVAAIKGHLDILKLLVDHDIPLCDSIYSDAELFGHSHVVAWLEELDRVSKLG